VLHSAARWGHTEVIELLIAHGADVHATCGEGDYGCRGYTPLQVAAKRGHRDAVAVLLARGAHGDLFSAACLGDAGSLRFLIDATHSPIDARDAYGATPLHWAVSAGQQEAARFLLAEKADVNVKDRRSRAPLLLAAIEGHTEMIDLLLEHRAALDLFSLTALGRTAAVASLLDADPALVQTTDASGWTALHWGARTGQLETARLLLERGADANARNENGRTPLWPAAYEGRYEELVTLLIAHGADVSARDQRDCGILAYDVGPEVAALLREHGATE